MVRYVPTGYGGPSHNESCREERGAGAGAAVGWMWVCTGYAWLFDNRFAGVSVVRKAVIPSCAVARRRSTFEVYLGEAQIALCIPGRGCIQPVCSLKEHNGIPHTRFLTCKVIDATV